MDDAEFVVYNSEDVPDDIRRQMTLRNTVDCLIYDRALSKREIHVVVRDLSTEHNIKRSWKDKCLDVYYFFYRR